MYTRMTALAKKAERGLSTVVEGPVRSPLTAFSVTGQAGMYCSKVYCPVLRERTPASHAQGVIWACR